MRISGRRKPRGGGGVGRQGGPQAAGPGGDCVCPVCGYRQTHKVGEPCYAQVCPQCGGRLARADSVTNR